MNEYPDVYRESKPIARKVHKCDECRCVIPKGQRYFYIWGVWDGEAQTYKNHLACHRFRERYNNHLQVNLDFSWEEVAYLGGTLDTLYSVQNNDGWLERFQRLEAWMLKRYGV